MILTIGDYNWTHYAGHRCEQCGRVERGRVHCDGLKDHELRVDLPHGWHDADTCGSCATTSTITRRS